MPITHKWLSDKEIERSKQLARLQTQSKEAHHYVPQMYLKRWALQDGSELSKQVLKTTVDNGETETRNPVSIAHAPFFYQVVGDDIDPDDVPDLWFEEHLSRIESDATWWLKALSDRPDGQITDINTIIELAVFVGLQSQRTLRARQRDLDIDAAIERYGAQQIFADPNMFWRACIQLGKPFDPSRRDEIANEIAREASSRRRISEASGVSKARAIQSAIDVWRKAVVPALVQQRTWWLYSTAKPLATCDEPVIYLGSPRGRHSPEAYVFANAPLVAFPIDPHHVLMLAFAPFCQPKPPYVLNESDTDALNFEIVAASHQLVFERIGSEIAAQISVPRRPSFDPSNAHTFWEFIHPPTRWGKPEPKWALERWVSPELRPFNGS